MCGSRGGCVLTGYTEGCVEMQVHARMAAETRKAHRKEHRGTATYNCVHMCAVAEDALRFLALSAMTGEIRIGPGAVCAGLASMGFPLPGVSTLYKRIAETVRTTHAPRVPPTGCVEGR